MEKHFRRYNRKILPLHNIQSGERLTKCFTFNSISSPSPPARGRTHRFVAEPKRHNNKVEYQLKTQTPTSNTKEQTKPFDGNANAPQRSRTFLLELESNSRRSAATESGAFIKDFEEWGVGGLTPSPLSRRWDVWKICGSRFTCAHKTTNRLLKSGKFPEHAAEISRWR